MDHVIESMKEWLRVYKDVPGEEKAVECIQNAITELEKYYDEH